MNSGLCNLYNIDDQNVSLVRYQCHPLYKYIANLIILYLILRYIVPLDINDDKIKGICIISIFISFILDTMTIENHHKLIFGGGKVKIEKTVQPILQTIDEELSDEEKSFIVDDIQSIKSINYDKISVTEKAYDTGIPIEKYENFISDTRKLQPYPLTSIKKHEYGISL